MSRRKRRLSQRDLRALGAASGLVANILELEEQGISTGAIASSVGFEEERGCEILERVRRAQDHPPPAA